MDYHVLNFIGTRLLAPILIRMQVKALLLLFEQYVDKTPIIRHIQHEAVTDIPGPSLPKLPYIVSEKNT